MKNCGDKHLHVFPGEFLLILLPRYQSDKMVFHQLALHHIIHLPSLLSSLRASLVTKAHFSTVLFTHGHYGLVADLLHCGFGEDHCTLRYEEKNRGVELRGREGKLPFQYTVRLSAMANMGG